MKLNQIAFCVPDLERAKELLTGLGAKFEMEDELTMTGKFGKNFADNVPIKLSFDYEMLKECNELELIESKDARHWHQNERSNNKSFLSHIGVYCESFTELKIIRHNLVEIHGYKEIQMTQSQNHTNKRQDGTERHYVDCIVDTSEFLGFNIKLTARTPL
jgi:hypothetical protein